LAPFVVRHVILMLNHLGDSYMSTTLKSMTCLISHAEGLSEIDLLAQNIEYALRNESIRMHGILSPYSSSYSSTLDGLEKIVLKLKQVYGLKSLIIDISVSGDNSFRSKIENHKLQRNDLGIYSSSDSDINILLLNIAVEESRSLLIENLASWKAIEESKKNFDLLFFLPSLKNPKVIKELDFNVQTQWLFLEKRNAAMVYKNINEQSFFQVPFMGIVTV
jgi:hypothetical protein